MGLMDKIKNALFEVEYVEVDDQEKHEDKPIAKKIVLPGKREEKVEELEEEELKNDHFEIRPNNEIIKEKPREEFKLMDDNDFKVEEDVIFDEPKEVSFENKVEKEEYYKEPVVENSYRTRVEKNETSSLDVKQNNLYGIDHSLDIDMRPYGTYENREEKSFFKPSPIISPIYGILDKNYRKEDVKERKNISISSYSSTHVTIDDVRNKAYGDEKQDENTSVTSTFEPLENDNVLVDLSDRSKPEVKELTMGDAIEYFQDLGLEYNVDYVDVSKENKATFAKHAEKIEEEKKDSDSSLENKNLKEDNDNLFDLIDSMYEEKD